MFSYSANIICHTNFYRNSDITAVAHTKRRTSQPTPATAGKISGSVVDTQGVAVESVKLRLKGIKTKFSTTTLSGADGSFEFTGLKADRITRTIRANITNL